MKILKVFLVVLVAIAAIQLTISVCFAQQYTAVSANVYHGLALRDDGTVWEWGETLNGDTLSPVQVPITGVKAIADSGDFGIALKDDGTVWTWGHNHVGQLGDGTTESRSAPVQVPISRVTAVAAGNQHALVLKDDGTVWGWGLDQSNQLGDGRTIYLPGEGPIAFSTTPVQVEGLSHVVKIFAGGSNSFAITDDGTLWGWGNNEIITGNVNIKGLLEQSDRSYIDHPVKINITDVKKVNIDDNAILVLKNDGTVWGWGQDTINNLGDWESYSPGNNNVRYSPVKSSVDHVADIADRMVLKDDGTVWTWGPGTTGELGTGAYSVFECRPVQAKISDVTQISAGANRVVLKKDGSVWAWGDNNCGAAGDGTTDLRRPAPKKILGSEENDQSVVVVSRQPSVPTPSTAVISSPLPGSSIVDNLNPVDQTNVSSDNSNSIVDLRLAGIVLLIIIIGGTVGWLIKKMR